MFHLFLILIENCTKKLYVFGYYSRVYGEGTANRNWGDAYTGMVLANSAASLIFGMYYVIAFTEKPTTTKMYVWKSPIFSF